MADRYEILPVKDKWGWQLRSEDTDEVTAKSPSPYATRAQALEAAKEHRGDETVTLYRADGEAAVEQHVRGPERILLLRPDGTVYGELDHELRPGGPPQYVTLMPATENDQAQAVEA